MKMWGETGDLREFPTDQGHDSHVRKSESDSAGNRTRFTYVGGWTRRRCLGLEVFTVRITVTPVKVPYWLSCRVDNSSYQALIGEWRSNTVLASGAILLECAAGAMAFGHVAESVTEFLLASSTHERFSSCSKKSKIIFRGWKFWSLGSGKCEEKRAVAGGTLFVSGLQLHTTGFNSRPVHSGLSQVEIVTDDTAGRRVFSGFSRFPCPFIPALLHTKPRFTLIGSQNLDVKSCKISSLTQHLIVDTEKNEFDFSCKNTKQSFACVTCKDETEWGEKVPWHSVKATEPGIKTRHVRARRRVACAVHAPRAGGDAAPPPYFLSSQPANTGSCRGATTVNVTTYYRRKLGNLSSASEEDRTFPRQAPTLLIAYIFTKGILLRQEASAVWWLDCSPPAWANKGSFTGGVAPGCPRVGIAPDDAAGRRGFSRGSPVSPVLSFLRCSVLASLFPHRLSRPRCQEPPKSLNSRDQILSRRGRGRLPRANQTRGTSPRATVLRAPLLLWRSMGTGTARAIAISPRDTLPPVCSPPFAVTVPGANLQPPLHHPFLQTRGVVNLAVPERSNINIRHDKDNDILHTGRGEGGKRTSYKAVPERRSGVFRLHYTPAHQHATNLCDVTRLRAGERVTLDRPCGATISSGRIRQLHNDNFVAVLFHLMHCDLPGVTFTETRSVASLLHLLCAPEDFEESYPPDLHIEEHGIPNKTVISVSPSSSTQSLRLDTCLRTRSAQTSPKRMELIEIRAPEEDGGNSRGPAFLTAAAREHSRGNSAQCSSFPDIAPGERWDGSSTQAMVGRFIFPAHAYPNNFPRLFNDPTVYETLRPKRLPCEILHVVYYGSSPRCYTSVGNPGEPGGGGKIPEKTRRPTASSGTIVTCENPGVARPGIEPDSPLWEASRLTAQPPWLL
ncbi:hypothetical protein PR048_028850 [Dryococelus australis]|uniref:Uncharacterized protein n=1 Tax=Dryococelus australis TaxID=614101 RepID=A0ABQ9GBR2_9NEOP|nr:hypothetical protein PR048_028850 [Dryococelus australis]